MTSASSTKDIYHTSIRLDEDVCVSFKSSLQRNFKRGSFQAHSRQTRVRIRQIPKVIIILLSPFFCSAIEIILMVFLCLFATSRFLVLYVVLHFPKTHEFIRPITVRLINSIGLRTAPCPTLGNIPVKHPGGVVYFFDLA